MELETASVKVNRAANAVTRKVAVDVLAKSRCACGEPAAELEINWKSGTSVGYCQRHLRPAATKTEALVRLERIAGGTGRA